MAYQSLYRRYRSGTFGELVGQEHVVTALKNAIVEGRVGHAYLFSGPRGTGKTSTARILGKALNCTDLQPDGEPCTRCDSCLAFASGTSYDLQELDAASNNGVEAIRDLISKVALGSPGRTKVYILDEVHMLTSGAENALLKTLEEPPPHVVFVLATTEPHKVVPTIRSRTQHYEFELLPADKLERHVRWIAEDAGLAVDDAMVDYVLRVGGGSARDTLSALDQVVAAGGVPRGDDVIDTVLDGLAGRDSGQVIAAVSAALTAGRDPRVIGESLLGRLRDSFLSSMGASVAHLSDTQSAAASELARRMGPAAITRSLEVIGTALIDMRQAPDPRVDLEVALLRLTRPELDTDIAAVLARVERLEQGLPAAPAGAAPPAAAPAPTHTAPAAAAGTPSATGAAAEPAGSVGVAGADVSAPAAPSPSPAASEPDSAPAPAPAAPPAGVRVRPGDAARAELKRALRGAPADAPPPPAAAPPRATLGATRGTAETSTPAPSSGDAAPTSPTAPTGPAGDASSAASSGAPPSGEPAEASSGPASAGSDARPSPSADREAGADGAGRPHATADEPNPASDAAPRGDEFVGAPGDSSASAGAGATGAVSVGHLEAVWDTVRGSLPGRARSRFSGGRFVSVTGDTVVFGLPNAIHRDRCADCAADVEAALSSHFGQALRLTLVVDGDAAPPPPRSGQPSDTLPPEPSDDEEAIDLTELIDAAPDEAGGVELLTEAFPGAEIIDIPPS